MDKVSGRLTVFFEEPFWIGVFERISEGKLSVCKVTFGAEPKDYEVYDFVLRNYYRLKFSPAVATDVKEAVRNPKRVQREVRKQVQNTGIGTGDAAYPGGSVYCATKAAVKALSDGLRIDLVDTPLRVTNVKPGMVETNFTVVRYRGDKEAADNFYKGIRPLTGDDIAETVYFAASAPAHIQIAEVLLMPTYQATGTISYKKKSE